MLFGLPYVIIVTWSPLLIIDMMTSRNLAKQIRKHFTIWLTGMSRLNKVFLIRLFMLQASFFSGMLFVINFPFPPVLLHQWCE